MAPYLAYIDQESRAKKVLSTHNVESLRFARELRFARGSRRVALLCDQILFHSWEKKSLRRFDGVAAVSESERAWIKRHAPFARVALIPNGVNTEYFSPAHERPSEEMFVVFTALMNYPPNIDAAQWFCRKILPIVRLEHPTLGFKIVGDKPGPAVLSLAKKQGVQVTGRVPDIRPYLNESLALVVPLRSGGGTRLKILEAMAMGRPVISTTQGAEGLKVTNGVNILLADTPEDFARHISALISDPQLGKRLGFAGRRLVEENYDWKTCLKRLEDFYRALLQRNPGKREVASATSAVEHPPDDEP
jgi:glycosyltransferase involved in cell wall biosynthesis